jgi:pyridoxine kinase
MNKDCKRILAINDLSGFGHTSLLAVIPVYYRLGIRVCALPTAVLSANTDYPDTHWIDLSEHLPDFAAHWQKLNLRFDAIHTGFLASPAQAQQVEAIITKLRSEDTLVLVDPVMGDHGEIYSCFQKDIVPAMQNLISQADIITPNYTEAALLAGADPILVHGNEDIGKWCRDLSRMGPRQVVITSVPSTKFKYPEIWHYTSVTDTLTAIPYPRIMGLHPGAGDCFAAFLLSGMVNGHSPLNSVNASAEIMTRALGTPNPSNSDPREGIPLEEVLKWDLRPYFAPPQI